MQSDNLLLSTAYSIRIQLKHKSEHPESTPS